MPTVNGIGWEWSQLDRWNMQTALAALIADGVETFAKSQHGRPAGVGDVATWEAILADIVKGFRAVGQLEDGPDMDDEGQAAYDRGIDLFATYFLDLWD